MKTDEAALLAAAVVAFYLAWRVHKAGAYIVTEKLNPASANNFIYDNIVGGIGRTLSNESEWSLGSWMYDVLNPNAGSMN